MVKNFFVLCAVSFISACTTTNFNSEQSLLPNEGLLLAKCNSRNHLALYIYKSDYVPNLIAPGVGLKASLNCSKEKETEDEVILVALEEGEYIIANSGFSATAPKFEIKSSKINYIGDFGETYSTSKRYGTSLNETVINTRHISFKDNIESTKKKFLSQYPEVAEKYELISSLALTIKK